MELIFYHKILLENVCGEVMKKFQRKIVKHAMTQFKVLITTWLYNLMFEFLTASLLV